MSSEILDIRFDVVDGNNPVEGRDQEGGISYFDLGHRIVCMLIRCGVKVSGMMAIF